GAGSASVRLLPLQPQLRQILAGERVDAGAARARDGELPALSRFHTVTRAEHEQIRDGTQCRQVLDRLMRWTVLAEPDGVMGHHEYDAIAHERRKANGRPAIIGEDQERAGIRNDP